MSARLKIFLAVLALAAAGAAVFTHLRVETDIGLFLPRSATPQERFLIHQFRQGPGARLLMVSLEGADIETLASLSKRLADRLRAEDIFLEVRNSDAPPGREAEAFLFERRYLLSPAVVPERFSEPGLRDTFRAALERLALSGGILERRFFKRDPTGEFLNLLASWQTASPLRKEHGVWVSGNGERALLLVEIAAPGFELDRFERALNTLDTLFHDSQPPPEVRLTASGPPAFAVASRAAIRHDATVLSLTATALVLALLLAVYRSVAVVLLSAFPLACGILAAVATVSAIFGSIHGITLGFGIVIIGVSVDYPIHWFSHLRPGEPPEDALRRIWPTLRLGVLTTALGYTSMMFSRFDGLIQLAVFSVSGLVAAAVATRYLLPLLVGPGTLREADRPLGRAFMNMAGRLRGWRLAVSVLCVGALAYLALSPQPVWENDVTRLSPIPRAQLDLDRQLRREMALPNPSAWLVVQGGGEQAVLETTEAVAAVLAGPEAPAGLEGFDSVTRFLPSEATQRRRLASLPPEARLRARLKKALAGLPFRPEGFEEFVRAVARAGDLPLLTRESLAATPLAAPVNKQLFRQGGNWFSMISLRGEPDLDSLRQALHAFAPENVFVLEPRRTSNAMINRYRDRALLFCAGGAGLIALILAARLRRGTVLARVLIPIGGATLVVMAALVAGGVRLTLFHLVALLLVVGLGLDYSLFLNHYRSTLERRPHTFHALLVCNASTLTVFGALAFSETPVLRAIGTTVALGAFLSLFFSLVFAPPGSSADPAP